ncbi:MAG: hypothetical protein NT074_00145 [Methanomicrobiales archaeon]|nr:hypothetical protein [Methanomicrobiales archaeon]
MACLSTCGSEGLGGKGGIPPCYSSSTIFFCIMTGRNFFSGSTVHHWKSDSQDIVARNVKTVSSQKITCLFSLPAGEVKGTWDIVVKNTDGAFTVR